jgi:hypothetical protein
LSTDFCGINEVDRTDRSVVEIVSDYLDVPYIAHVGQCRVSMAETPGELRCIPYPTDGGGLLETLEKWCDASFSFLFLAMAEKVTRAFGFVFKNRNQYGTETIGHKKVKFTPIPNTNDVDIVVLTLAVRTTWSRIPGSTHLIRLYVVLFGNLAPYSE